jgi:hypothetical protein
MWEMIHYQLLIDEIRQLQSSREYEEAAINSLYNSHGDDSFFWDW